MEDNKTTMQQNDEKKEPMSGTQHAYLKNLAEKTGNEVDESLTKDEAVKKIEALEIKQERKEQG